MRSEVTLELGGDQERGPIVFGSGRIYSLPPPVSAVDDHGVASLFSFELPTFAEDDHLRPMLVTLSAPDTPSMTKHVYLSRVAVPPRDYTGSVVQIDYASKTMIVNGNPFIGTGYYDSQTVSEQNMSRLAKAGLTWGMRYFLSNDPHSTAARQSDDWIESYLDWAHSTGTYVMFDVFDLYENIAGPADAQHIVDPDKLLANISQQIRRFKDHPALLGWYICDDCNSQYVTRVEKNPKPYLGKDTLLKLYQYSKSLDPYHPLVGAYEAANAYTVTTGNERIPGGKPILDLVMMENYVADLSTNARTGLDGRVGTFAGWPLTHEPIVNCPGPWLVAQKKYAPTDVAYKNLEVQAEIMYTMSWLSVVAGGDNLKMQLQFRLFPFKNSSYSGNPVYEHMLSNGIGKYARLLGKLHDYMFLGPSSEREPWVEVVGGMNDHTLSTCRQCARLWRKDYGPTSPEFCALLVALNTLNTTAPSVELRLRDSGKWQESAENMQMVEITDESESTRRKLKFDGGKAILDIAPYSTHVYVTEGCGTTTAAIVV
jgi:hypothetical protein